VIKHAATDHSDVVLVYAQNIGQGDQSFIYGLGAAYVASNLRKHGLSVLQFAPPGHLSIAEAARSILALRPRVVGFTIYTTNFDSSVLLADALKSLSPETIVVFGGPTPTTLDREVLRTAPSVDICVRGYGEDIMLHLMMTIVGRNWRGDWSSLREVGGLTFREGTEHIRTNDSNVLLEIRRSNDLLDRYASPHLAGFVPSEAAIGHNGTGIITGRGCNQNCTFCNCAIISERKLFTHSLERVVDEIACIATAQPGKLIAIQDDTFTLIRPRAHKICEGLLKRNVSARLSCITRCDDVDAHTLDLMRAAGVVRIGFALESATPRVLRAIGKVKPAEDAPTDDLAREKQFIEKLKWAVAYCRQAGYESIFTSIMVGLPGETPEEARETVRFVGELDVDGYEHNNLMVYSDTPMFAKHEQYGYDIECTPGYMRTTHSFDVVREVPVGKNASKVTSALRNNLLAARTLSLSPSRNGTSDAFESVIFIKDELSKDDVNWLKNVLVVDGLVLHLYSSSEAAETHRDKNYSLIKATFKPTKRWFSYYPEQTEAGYQVMRFMRDFRTIEDFETALSVALAPTCRMNCSPHDHGIADQSQMVCVDETRDDALALHAYLSNFGKSADAMSNALLGGQRMPQLSSLCRWTHASANCQTLTVAIVDSSQGVRLCWHDTPIGRVGDSLPVLREAQRRRLAKVEEARGCAGCSARSSCVKCAVPFPLKEEEYCRLQREAPVQNSAELLSVLNILNDVSSGGNGLCL
jgi:radical SAM superfamily enzyme YgiQ (UPF0313 family)